MPVSLSLFAGAGWQFFDNNGTILSGGKLYTYAAGTTTPLTTYTSSSGVSTNTNPIVLDSAGRVPYEIWISTTATAKFILKDSTDVLIGTWDNIPSYASSLNLTGTNNAVAYFNSVGTFTSSSNMTFDGSNLTVSGGITAGSNVAITGNISTTGTATFGGNTAVTGTISATGGITSNTTAVTQSPNDNSTKIATTAYVTNATSKAKIQPLTTSNVSGGGFRINLAPTTIDFRDVTTSSGAVTTVSNASTIYIDLTGAATLGSVSAWQTRIVVLAIYNSSIAAMELAVVNITGGLQLDETNVLSSTTAVTSGTSASVVYSTTARTNVVYRVVGFIDCTNTAGSWSTPALVQGIGGQPLAALSSIGFGQTWIPCVLGGVQQSGYNRLPGIVYYNTTGKPIQVSLQTSDSGTYAVVYYGTTSSPTTIIARTVGYGPGGNRPFCCAIIPPNGSYKVDYSGLEYWTELR